MSTSTEPPADLVLGSFTDPKLPVRSIDVAVFHDVLHHVQERGAYLQALARYLTPSGRIVVIDYEGGMGPHREQPALEVTRQQLLGWMKDAGFAQADEVKLFPDKYFLVFAKRSAAQAAAPQRTRDAGQGR